MGKKACFDIGHGEDTYDEIKQTGLKGYKDFEEFDFNNKVVKLAKPLAEFNGFEVFLSQPIDGNEVPLNKRTSGIKAAKCNVVVSVHANASNLEKPSGYGCYYWKTDESAKRLAYIWERNAAKIMGNLGNRASHVHACDLNNNNFAMLRTNAANKIPAILLEEGFFTNNVERKLLSTEAFQYKCAQTIVKTLCDYYALPFKEPTYVEKTEWEIILETVSDGRAEEWKKYFNEQMKSNGMGQYLDDLIIKISKWKW